MNFLAQMVPQWAIWPKKCPFAFCVILYSYFVMNHILKLILMKNRQQGKFMNNRFTTSVRWETLNVTAVHG